MNIPGLDQQSAQLVANYRDSGELAILLRTGENNQLRVICLQHVGLPEILRAAADQLDGYLREHYA